MYCVRTMIHCCTMQTQRPSAATSWLESWVPLNSHWLKLFLNTTQSLSSWESGLKCVQFPNITCVFKFIALNIFYNFLLFRRRPLPFVPCRLELPGLTKCESKHVQITLRIVTCDSRICQREVHTDNDPWAIIHTKLQLRIRRVA